MNYDELERLEYEDMKRHADTFSKFCEHPDAIGRIIRHISIALWEEGKFTSETLEEEMRKDIERCEGKK